MDFLVKKVWGTVSKKFLLSYENENPYDWETWTSKPETLRVFELSEMVYVGLLETAIARKLKKSLIRQADNFFTAKEVFDHVCDCWELQIVGKRLEDAKRIVRRRGKDVVFYTKDERLPIRENESFCDILVEGSVCLGPVFHEKMSALEELKRTHIKKTYMGTKTFSIVDAHSTIFSRSVQ